MPFIDARDPDREWEIGPAEGARAVFVGGGGPRRPAGFFVGLHRHGGDEGIRVVSGRIRFVVGDDSAILGPGQIAFIPPAALHGFHCLEEAQLEVFGEQRMGEWVLVLGADGSRREVEVWGKGFPWARPLPPGKAHTTRDELWS